MTAPDTAEYGPAERWAKLTEERDEVTDVIERIAKRLMDAEEPKPWTRRGQSPHLVDVDSDRCHFKVTNNRDDHDDFYVSYPRTHFDSPGDDS